MRQLIKTVHGSTFLRHNLVFFVGSLAISILNYLYYPVLSRLLHPASFGEIQVLVTMFLQIGIFLAVMGTLTINIITNHEATPQRDRVILELEKLAFIISAVLLLVSLLFSSSLQRFFRFEEYLPFIVLGISVVITVPFTFRSAYLRGRQQFGLTSIAGIIGAAAKLIFSVLFVYIGWGTTGAMAGIVLAQFLAFCYAAVYARRLGFKESLFKQILQPPDIRLIMPELRYAGLILVCSLTMTALYSIDIIVVKHLFSAQVAGLYAGVATVARIIFFLTASITQVLLPSVRISQGGAHNRAILLKSFLLLSGIGAVAVIAFWLLPRYIVGHLMGHSYLTYASLLPRLGLAVFLISVLNLFVNYHLALRRFMVAVVVLLGAGVTGAFLGANHDTLSAVVNDLLFGSIAMFALLGGWVGVETRKHYKETGLWLSS